MEALHIKAPISLNLKVMLAAIVNNIKYMSWLKYDRNLFSLTWSLIQVFLNGWLLSSKQYFKDPYSFKAWGSFIS